MRHEYDEFVAADAEILAIGPENLAAFQQYWVREELPFVGLADPTHTVANRYRQEVNLLKLGRMPAVLVVDKTGQVRYRHDGDSMADIPANAEILAVLGEINRRGAGLN